MPEVIAFKKHAGCREVTFPQCAFGSMFRKMTIFFLTPALGHILGGVNNLRCTHTHHEQRADGTPRYAKMRVLEGALPGTQHAKQQRSTVTNEGRKKSRIQKNSKKRPPKSGQQVQNQQIIVIDTKKKRNAPHNSSTNFAQSTRT